MAFTIDYMGRVNTSANSDALKVWTYNDTSTGSNETLATIVASAYFNSFQQKLTSGSEFGPLAVGDIIHVHGNDASGSYLVSSITTNVTLAVLGVGGLTPSHVVVYAGEETTAGGDATEAVTVSGVLATDLVFTQLHTVGSTPRTILTSVASANTVTTVFSGDPSTDHVYAYQVLRAVV